MARRTTGGFAGRQRASRPNRSWNGLVSSAATNVAGTSKVLLGSFTPSNSGIDETILRSRGMFAIETDNSGATEEQVGAFGLIVVTDNAFAAGVASIPGPATDVDDDGWFVWVPIVQRFEFVSAVGVEPQMATQYQIDSHAKRIVSDGQTVAIIVENFGAGGFTININFRILSQVRGTR